ncbi:exodeoxyribonuclease VII large subunit [Pseudomonas sp. CDFA 553]|uniref:exodeoxyribonuclease VII large subunit n=1 Tax=Pseudomonas quasicaspiana TaxID=2829821 RepID=UPI002228533C|nr:exodeoxyribonuclease VII large subunit [Pseudomonas quasicaspiana]MCD5986505.1 exodeoxyribonuclease VII large subunit [Pseudomonas quasicaspiana]
MSGSDKDVHLSLQSYLLQVQSVVKQHFAQPTWVIAELSDFQVRANGYCYLSLIESSAGKEVAKCSASMVPGVANVQLKAFRSITGSDPSAGMKLLLNVAASVHPQYGFQLQIQMVDGTYTAGDMKAKVEKIIERLKSEGYYDLQKQLPAPDGYWRVAVVSPEQAAGLGDFRRDADRLESHELVQFVYYDAVFQGERAAKTIKDALRQVFADHETQPYDVVCLIRGGGAKADLGWLNDHKLAIWICKIPIPVYTGIGHERDETLLDLVAHTRFDTPSKVVGAIMRRLQSDAEALQGVIYRGTAEVERLVSTAEAGLQNLNSNYRQVVSQLLSESTQNFIRDSGYFHAGVQQLLHDQQLMLQQTTSRTERMLTEYLAENAAELSDLYQRCKLAVGIAERTESERLQQFWNSADGLIRWLVQQEINAYKQQHAAYHRLIPSLMDSEETRLGSAKEQILQCSMQIVEYHLRVLQLNGQKASALADALLTTERSTLSILRQRYASVVLSVLQAEEHKLDNLSSLFAALDPRSIMAKGFAMVKTKGGRTHRGATTIAAGMDLIIQFHDGEVLAVAGETKIRHSSE